jgi:hypothetical protein
MRAVSPVPAKGQMASPTNRSDMSLLVSCGHHPAVVCDHAATDQMRKTPISTAIADQARIKAGDCLDHQASSDLKRATPINGRIMAENTDTALRTIKTAGNRDRAAAPQSATPNANRIANAVQRPLWVCQVDTNLTIASGEIKPKTPMPPRKIETAMTMNPLKFITSDPGLFDRQQ